MKASKVALIAISSIISLSTYAVTAPLAAEYMPAPQFIYKGKPVIVDKAINQHLKLRLYKFKVIGIAVEGQTSCYMGLPRTTVTVYEPGAASQSNPSQLGQQITAFGAQVDPSFIPSDATPAGYEFGMTSATNFMMDESTVPHQFDAAFFWNLHKMNYLRLHVWHVKRYKRCHND